MSKGDALSKDTAMSCIGFLNKFGKYDLFVINDIESRLYAHNVRASPFCEIAIRYILSSAHAMHAIQYSSNSLYSILLSKHIPDLAILVLQYIY